MSSYAFWNNKGGVGKSFLCFVAASEYAHRHPDTDVYVIDLCPLNAESLQSYRDAIEKLVNCL
jgi:cellulose biosynthesis protein BcsQ